MPYIYSSSDAGAPVLTGQPGSFVALLNKILVGDPDAGGYAYGDKMPLGWTLEFTGSNQAVWRNNPNAPGSTGCYLKLVNQLGATQCRGSVFKSMTSLTEGTNETPNTSMHEQSLWAPSESQNAEPRAWLIMGDDRTFYINVMLSGTEHTNNSYYAIYGAGDYESLVPAHDHNYFCISSTYSYDSSSSFGNWSMQNNSSRGFALGRNMTNAGSPVFGIMVCPGHMTGGSSQPTFPNIYSGMIHSAPALIHDGTNGYCGFLRGVRYMMSRQVIDWKYEIGPGTANPTSEPYFQMLARHPVNGWVPASILVSPDYWT